MGAQTTVADAIRQAELDLILDREAGKAHEPPDVWGLALSGGGIRSATFALGVLQVLARKRLLGSFHYLSTISGGGYIGAFVQGLIRRRGFDGAVAVLSSTIQDVAGTKRAPSADTVDENRPILHLREYSNYLSPRKSAVSGDTLGMVGTYVRNVLLVQTQLFALLLSVSLFPLMLYPVMLGGAAGAPRGLLVASGALGAVAALMLGWILWRSNRCRAAVRAGTAATPPASAGTHGAAAGAVDRRDLPSRTVAWVANVAILVLFVSAWLGAAGFWGINTELLGAAGGSLVTEHARKIARAFDIELAAAVAATYFVAWMIWFIAMLVASRRSDAGAPRALGERKLRFVAATMAASLIGGAVIVVTRHLFSAWVGSIGLWQALIIGPTVVLAAVTVIGIFHIGLAGPALTDLQREIWARIGGRAMAFIALAIGVSSAIVIYGPFLARATIWHAEHSTLLTTTGIAGLVTWIVTTGAGVFAAHGQRTNGNVPAERSRSTLLDAVAYVAPWVFLLGLAIGVAFAAQQVLSLVGWQPVDAGFRYRQAGPDEHSYLAIYLANLAGNATQQAPMAGIVAVVALLVWLGLAIAVDLNEFSMNAFYRNRIVRCYLGASNARRVPEPTTNFDPNDDIALADVVALAGADPDANNAVHSRPLFPLVGTTLNLVATRQLDWQDRKGASFCLTPLFSGYVPPPSHPGAETIGDQASPRDKTIASALTLGDAVAISGAAVSPNMGYHSSPAVTFLLALFDARLGWWLRNPNRVPKKPGPPVFSGGWLLAETLGLTNESGSQIYLSDGGHFENLGIYELVRRRCRFILAVDSGADPARDFADLGDAIQKCRTDFGADLEIDTSDLRRGPDGLSRRACAVGTIRYADGERGVLLYLKPSITGAETADVAHYARAHPSFPHEPTSDQFFDEAQFESYRRLGEAIASAALDGALDRANATPTKAAHGQLGLVASPLKERILVELRHAWAAQLPTEGRFSRHAEAMAALFAKQRETPSLAVLDAQMYPAWVDFVEDKDTGATARRTQMPAPKDFRSCFYFCQELIQLMESVYHDMALEKNWQHPDHRGWMNVFRHWSGSPAFRVAWAIGAPTFGRGFVTFCELRLGLTRLDDVLIVRDYAPEPGVDWAGFCAALAGNGTINHVESSVLTSSALNEDADPKRFTLLLLRMKWAPMLKELGGSSKESTLGIAVLEGATLRVLRIQDHLRRMGLGAEFVRRLIMKRRVEAVDVRKGHYGVVGVLGERESREAQRRLECVLARANRIHRERSETASRIARHKQMSRRAAPEAGDGSGLAGSTGQSAGPTTAG
jgi:hypothetical protein